MVPVPWRAASRRGFPSRKAAPVTLPQLWLLDHDLQTDISVALERAWREAMPGKEERNAQRHAARTAQAAEATPSCGPLHCRRWRRSGCKSSTMASPASAVSTSMGSIAATLKTI